MAWTKASLKLVLGYVDDKGDDRTKSKSFSNLKQDAIEANCKAVAEAISAVQKYNLVGLSRVDYTDIEL